VKASEEGAIQRRTPIPLARSMCPSDAHAHHRRRHCKEWSKPKRTSHRWAKELLLVCRPHVARWPARLPACQSLSVKCGDCSHYRRGTWCVRTAQVPHERPMARRALRQGRSGTHVGLGSRTFRLSSVSRGGPASYMSPIINSWTK
jgi:hypothetical protein